MSEKRSRLEDLVEPAMDGDRAAAGAFLKAFLDETLFVPERQQAHKMSDAPQYPNEILNILGVQDKERVIVPVFSRRELIEAWCGNPLLAREMTGKELVSLLPEEWWICINPAAEIEKELSPWEMEQLRAGPEGIEAILDEIFHEDIVEPLEIKPISAAENEKLVLELRQLAERSTAIGSLWLLRQSGTNRDGDIVDEFLIGIQVPASERESLSELREEARLAATRVCMGGDRISVLGGVEGDDDMTMGLFLKVEPLFRRNSRKSEGSFLSRLFPKGKGKS